MIGASDAVVLPGVGAFGACMAALRARDLEQPVFEAATSGRPFLGICVGMQMLFDASEESPGVAGLGVIPGTVRWITGDVKKPQMQWNILDVASTQIRCSPVLHRSRGFILSTPCTVSPMIRRRLLQRASTGRQ